MSSITVKTDDNRKIREAIEILQRRLFKPNTSFMGPEQVQDFLFLKHAARDTEAFGILYLNSKNNLIKEEILFEGTINATAVYPREVVIACLKNKATACIVFHNHPSGDTMPSREDIDITRKLTAALNTVGVSLHDHIIIGDKRDFMYSFANTGEIDLIRHN